MSFGVGMCHSEAGGRRIREEEILRFAQDDRRFAQDDRRFAQDDSALRSG